MHKILYDTYESDRFPYVFFNLLVLVVPFFWPTPVSFFQPKIPSQLLSFSQL